ncbi:MAG: dTDP-4-dehydrorhamnose 3,5-epimerase family protein [Solirubrobacterales bacterium]
MSTESSPSPAPTLAAELPDGVRLIELTTHADDRGSFTELFRSEWDTGFTPVQWNLVHTGAGVMRGVHVHVKHTDYLLIVDGEMTLALSDLRDGSPTKGLTTTVLLSADSMRTAVIPPGVAHGFLFERPGVLVYGVDRVWDIDDELGVRWDDPDLGIEWPAEPSIVNDRDRELQSLDQLLAELAPLQPGLWPPPPAT